MKRILHFYKQEKIQMASIKKVETQKNYKLGCKFIREMPAQAYIVSRPSGVTSAILLTTAIPRDTLPLDMLTPQIRHYELRQKNSRYANFSDLSTPSYAIF